MSHNHNHGDHSHGEADGQGHSHVPPDPALRVQALETLLLEKGMIDPEALNTIIDTYANEVGPRNGARVVARAWVDAAYRAWLLKDATAAIADMGYVGRQGEHVVAVENTPAVHNIIVCTLCSCYPWSILGLPPAWYKSEAYRARVVREPRAVLAEFGVQLDPEVEIRVWDSTSEMRYLVVPQRPDGTDDWSIENLADLVTRDSMIGAGFPSMPECQDMTS